MVITGKFKDIFVKLITLMSENEKQVFLTGYTENWANNLNPIITGVYNNWNKAVSQAITLQNINEQQYNGLRQVQITEMILNNELKSVDINPLSQWFTNYTWYKVINKNGKIIIEKNNYNYNGWEQVSQKSRRKKR